MFNCNGIFPISKCSGGDLKFNLRDNQKQYGLSSSHNLENKVSISVINNGKDFAENQNNADNAPHCVTNVGGPGNYLSNMYRFNNKMYENNSGLDKKHASYARYLSRKKGWNLLNQNCIINQTEVCLTRNSSAIIGNDFNFNKIRPSNTTYILDKGTYLIKDIPLYHGFILINADDANMINIKPLDVNKFNLKMSILSGYAANLNNDIVANTKFYYGDIIIEVLGDFGKATIYEYKYGYKDNGQDIFKFDSRDRCT
jgi:hypothetical protein